MWKTEEHLLTFHKISAERPLVFGKCGNHLIVIEIYLPFAIAAGVLQNKIVDFYASAEIIGFLEICGILKNLGAKFKL